MEITCLFPAEFWDGIGTDLETEHECARLAGVPAQTLEYMAINGTPMVHEKLAGRTDLPPVAFARLASDLFRSVRKSVASNPACPIDALVGLAVDGDGFVRAGVARNPKCPPEVLTRIFESEPALHGPVCEALATNPACPAGVAKALAGHENNEVRAALAEQAQCPRNAFAILARDTALNVRIAVLSNEACPDDIAATVGVDHALNGGIWLWPAMLALERFAPGEPGVWEAAGTLLLAGFAGTAAELVNAARAASASSL